jgi:hypothetical protein
MSSLIVALGAAVVGAVLGAYLQKLWTPNPAAQIASLRQDLVGVQEQIQAFEKGRISQKKEDELWTSKFEAAASQIVKVGPSLTISSPEGNSITPLYGLIFPEVETRTRIQTFLVEPDSRYTSFSMRMLSAEHLRRPVVRGVVDETLECLGAFKKKYPNLAAKYL